MILVTITQESRRMALADMLNAYFLGADLVEIRLDVFEKDANLSEIISAKKTPLMFSCKRPKDGGQWSGTEEERLTLLRTAIISKADYVDIELDIADQIRPFPGCKRVISYTNRSEVPSDIADIYKEMLTKKPDIIRITCRASTPEEAWPLVQILNKPTIPTVITGLGYAGRFFPMLGRKIGAPWCEACLERGMEAYEGQANIRQLTEGYLFRDIGKPTRFVGVTGTDERSFLLSALINCGLSTLGKPHRVLPIQVGSLKTFRKIADAVRLQGVSFDESCWEHLHELAVMDENAKPPVAAADFVAPTDGHWTASNLFGPAVKQTLLDAVSERWGPEEPLKGRTVLFVGGGAMTRMIAPLLKQEGMSLIFAEKTKEAGQKLAQTFTGRHVLREAIYSTNHDLLLLTKDSQTEEFSIHPGYLKPTMVVFDLSQFPKMGTFHSEAESRDVPTINPLQVIVAIACVHLEKLLGESIPNEVREKMNETLQNWT